MTFQYLNAPMNEGMVASWLATTASYIATSMTSTGRTTSAEQVAIVLRAQQSTRTRRHRRRRHLQSSTNSTLQVAYDVSIDELTYEEAAASVHTAFDTTEKRDNYARQVSALGGEFATVQSIGDDYQVAGVVNESNDDAGARNDDFTPESPGAIQDQVGASGLQDDGNSNNKAAIAGAVAACALLAVLSGAGCCCYYGVCGCGGRRGKDHDRPTIRPVATADDDDDRSDTRPSTQQWSDDRVDAKHGGGTRYDEEADSALHQGKFLEVSSNYDDGISTLGDYGGMYGQSQQQNLDEDKTKASSCCYGYDYQWASDARQARQDNDAVTIGISSQVAELSKQSPVSLEDFFESQDEYYEVTVPSSVLGRQKLGMLLADKREGGQPPHVHAIKKDGLLAASCVDPGDYLVAVEGTDVTSMSADSVSRYIGEAAQEYDTLTFAFVRTAARQYR